MSVNDTKDVLDILRPFDEQTTELFLWLRKYAWSICPRANELVYDNYNAVAIGWSPSTKLGHTICSIAIMRANQNIHWGFYHGSKLEDPLHLLLGKGSQYRYILVKDKKTFPRTYIKQLVQQAYVNSLGLVKDERDITSGQTIIKSISAKKRPGKKVNTI
ncbi:MAG: hypothetical protein ACM3VS_13335 [Candidatus Dadabacteria bacterium]